MFIFLGAIKCGHRSTRDMGSRDGVGVDLFSCIMSERRFLFLLEAIKLDNIRDRNECKKVDKITHIRKIFDRFVENSKNAYSISEYSTLDEKLQ